MSSLIQAVRMEYPETIPVKVGILPSMWFKYGSEVQRFTDQYPQFFGGTQVDIEAMRANMAPTFYRGAKVADEWGCIWENEIEGNEGIVKQHPLKTEEDVYRLQIPKNRDGRLQHGFMYLRLLDLCGFEDAMCYFAEEGETLRVLIDKVLEYNLYQIAAVLPRMGDMIHFADDLGIQTGLAIGAERWRRHILPCYRKMFGLVKSYNPSQLIHLHSDGCIHEIIPDLVDCGLDVINPQFRANGLDNLVRVCRKERTVAMDLDLDRQLFAVATPSQLHDHVAEAVESLYLPQGGLALTIWFDSGDNFTNMAALLDAVEKYRHYKG